MPILLELGCGGESSIMTDEQRRYKIQKKESYEKRSSDKKWEAVRKTFWLGIWGLH